MSVTLSPEQAQVEAGMQAIVDDPAMRRAAWRDLMKRGVVVTIRMSRWRPQASLTPVDLGLPVLEREQQRRLNRLMPLGKKLLVTPDMFAKLTTAEAGPRTTELSKRRPSLDQPV